jgi:hypothetical protein
MPDADDFDIEYFRNLLKGDAVKQETKAPAPSKKAARSSTPPAKSGTVAKPKKRPGR